DLGRKYGKSASKNVERAMHKEKRGTLKSGRSGKKVTNPKQAIAIGLSEAREKGAKVPPAKKGKKKTSRKGSSTKRKSSSKSSSTRRKSSSKK
ncbi:MAG TPA: DUF6496 domain-containing protein, partial [Burkholderiales bacterium]|nr:DUF6496 domain-containing protein [Burkholderiales bacterium]